MNFARTLTADDTMKQVTTMVAMMKLSAVLFAVFATLVVAGCADMPGADGRYATHDRGGLNREGGSGLPVTPYVPR
jgi:hypothetical protein